ncbi:MAG: phosphate signaling complex protein PhoU [Ignavibacteriales bacterium]|nr:phosphate signaling complex protein PhoU [Ignavibacteriales bacterium]
MERRFEKELEGLKTSLIKMGSVVEENITLAVKALLEDDDALAKQVIAADERVNSLEIEIDNGVIDILALQQPVASDLRLIIAVQKISNDLERIGDHAVNIAESVLSLHETPKQEPLYEIPPMCNIAREMLRNALDGFILLDPQLARTVLQQDDKIDELNRTMTQVVIEEVKSGKQSLETGMQLIRISRNLERVGDLATNIAEDVIFHTQARVVKHHAENGRPLGAQPN